MLSQGSIILGCKITLHHETLLLIKRQRCKIIIVKIYMKKEYVGEQQPTVCYVVVRSIEILCVIWVWTEAWNTNKTAGSARNNTKCKTRLLPEVAIMMHCRNKHGWIVLKVNIFQMVLDYTMVFICTFIFSVKKFSRPKERKRKGYCKTYFRCCYRTNLIV